MKIQVENYINSKKRPRKRGKFAISVNEQGRVGYYIKKLKYFLKETYPFLKEECAFYREKSLKAAKSGDYIVFGTGKKYDYTVMSLDSFNENPAISDKTTIFDLEAGFKLVKKAIDRYVEKNYPWKVPSKSSKPHHYVSCNHCKAVLPNTRPVVTCPKIVVTTPLCRPVHVVKAPRSYDRKWNAEVNNTYVLLTNGHRYETVNIRRSGSHETVCIDGTHYSIRRNNLGQGIII